MSSTRIASFFSCVVLSLFVLAAAIPQAAAVPQGITTIALQEDTKSSRLMGLHESPDHSPYYKECSNVCNALVFMRKIMKNKHIGCVDKCIELGGVTNPEWREWIAGFKERNEPEEKRRALSRAPVTEKSNQGVIKGSRQDKTLLKFGKSPFYGRCMRRCYDEVATKKIPITSHQSCVRHCILRIRTSVGMSKEIKNGKFETGGKRRVGRKIVLGRLKTGKNSGTREGSRGGKRRAGV
ncbi:hypothetical protein AX15_002867 [Amanita polypyramis BW_CC]|nr:hypothetical protein AX15_002867 [Amanita polypyramis BW_CC]